MQYIPYTSDETARLKLDYRRLGSKGFPDIVERHGIDSVRATARHLGLTNKNRSFNKEDMTRFKKVIDPEIAYLLGFLWADGHIPTNRNRIMLLVGESDGKQLKDLIHSTADSWYSRAFNGYGKSIDKRYINYAISSQDLTQYLIGLDYHIKSDVAPVKVLKTIPEDLRHYWWRGYFDGDGCFYFNEKLRAKKVQITAGYDHDWSFAKRLFKQLSVDYSLERACSTGCRSAITVVKHDSLVRFMDYLYAGEAFGLQRKKLKYEAYLAYYAKMHPNKIIK